MSLWTLIKIVAGIVVLAVMGFTGMLAWHVVVAPLGGVFEKIIPNPADVTGRQPDADFAKQLDTVVPPDIDPGEKAFQKAHELLALGKLDEAREKLTAIINTYPGSISAPVARRIVGEMTLDELLSSSNLEGKKTHIVKRGNSFFGIASEYHTSLDMIMFLNGMMEMKNLQPGDELVVMPLDFRLLIEPQRKSLSLWDGGRFIRDYPIIHFGVTGTLSPGKTQIASKMAELDGRKIAPQSKEYRAAEKIIQLAKPAILIHGSDESEGSSSRGIVLSPQDMEEISLLTRVGNAVEIR